MDAATGAAIGSPVLRTAPITSIDISYDGRYLVAGANKEAALIDPDSGVDVMPVMKCGAGIKKARVSTAGSQIATMLDDGGIRFWDARSRGRNCHLYVREDGHLTDISWGPVGGSAPSRRTIMPASGACATGAGGARHCRTRRPC